MMAELLDDNKQLTASVREVHGLCDEHEHGDIATASLLEIWKAAAGCFRPTGWPNFVSRAICTLDSSLQARHLIPNGNNR
jgi:hypothetical protein